QTATLREFIASEMAADELWAFVHIPKTAGSSFASELAHLRPPYRNIHVDYSDEVTPHAEKMQAAVRKFVDELPTAAFRSCSGHINMNHAARIMQAAPGMRVISFLRNPVARVISDFRYARTPVHPPHRDFIKQYPTIFEYVDSP